MREAIRQFIDVIKRVLSEPIPVAADNFDESVLESDRRTRVFGYWIVAIVFGGFGLWAAIAPLESAARGQGTVQVEGNRKPLQHYEGGMVAEIFVASGDYVKEGQALIQLDTTQAQAEQRIIEGRVWAKRALVDRLISERDDLDSIVFQSWLLDQTDERAQIAVASERALFDARRADRLGEIAVLQQRISQLTSQIDGALAVTEAKNQVAASLQSERVELEDLLEQGYVDKQRIRQLERSLAQTLGELAELGAQVAAAKVAIEETELTILQLDKRFRMQVVDALTASQDELYDMQQRLLAINDRLSRTLISAPASGYVLGLKPNVRGAVIAPGDELMSIVPDVDQLVIDAKMSPMDIDRIKVGQEAEVRFAVFKDAYTITGELVKVSADSLRDEATGETYFEAKVELLSEDLALLGEEKLVPGMPADVLVKTGNRTLLGYLTSPLQRMFENSLIED
jgi:epimerase transport system membrane fusion protein